LNRYICIHGHFYQPPRENPWLEAVELQDSAAPFHDWNARITAECYASNAASRILDSEGQIVRIVNNYSKISFNFGATLLRWLQTQEKAVYEAILEADWESRRRYSGHGSALAQAYHHSILPLANRRDKYTEVRWGIVDFRSRFGRDPEGMWLPETAVDLETLEILAQEGIQFTILSPYQAKRTRHQDQSEWVEASEGRVDPQKPYRVELPSGGSIAVFFYDGPISRAVAFENLLRNGEYLANRLLGAFSDELTDNGLVHIATDGETYGHHHRHGEMALAYALHYIEENKLACLTNYGEYLEKNPPTYVAEIFKNTSWSCAHGIERWRSDCGCHTGGEPGWNQAWRGPLRDALDWLRDRIMPLYEMKAGRYFSDVWAVRDEYVTVLTDRSPEAVSSFLNKHSGRELQPDERVECLKLLELQRHCLLMYTSCGWFFNELSGIETVQVLQYAGRALQLAESLFGQTIESEFLERLRSAPSNIPELQNGETIFKRFVHPTRVELTDVGAHYAISSLFEPYDEQTDIYCFKVNRRTYEARYSGNSQVALGQLEVVSTITEEKAAYCFGAIHLGDHNLTCGIRESDANGILDQIAEEVFDVFSRADIPGTLRLIDNHFQDNRYSLKSLFRDQRRKVLDHILEPTIDHVEHQYREIYERQASLMRFLAGMQEPRPRVFQAAAEFALSGSLRQCLRNESLDLEEIFRLVNEAREGGIRLDAENLGFEFTQALERMFTKFQKKTSDLEFLEKLRQTIELTVTLPFQINYWAVQNIFYGILQRQYPRHRNRQDPKSQKWVEEFRKLGEMISVRVAP